MQEKGTVEKSVHMIQINMAEDEDKEYPDTSFSKEEEIETIHVYIYREEPKDNNSIVDADTAKKKTHPFPLVIAIFFASLLPIFSIAFQIFILLNPPTATITLIPIQKELSARTDMHLVTINPTSNEILGHMLIPITISESKIALATGRGHQDTTFASGTITFYNGSFSTKVIPQGTQLTGRSGVTVVTDETAYIPPAQATTPPTFGETSVSAHATFSGSIGNIPAGDINFSCCASSVLAQNTATFRGGMIARDFSFVTSSDIGNAINPLTKQVSQTVQTSLLSEVTAGQSLIPPSCSTKIFSDHKTKDEAAQVKVTVSQTCIGVTYDTAYLQEKGSQILMHLAKEVLGVHYFPIYGIQTSVAGAAMSSVFPIRASISVFIHGTWFYQFSKSEITFLKATIAGKPINTALHLVQTLPEVKEVRIQFQGFGNSYYLPKDPKYIRVAIIYKSV